MVTHQQILDFYTRPTAMTSGGKHARLFEALPNDVGELTRIIQSLVVYENVAADFYGFDVPDERKSETYIRPIEKMLERLLAIGDQPLDITRPINKRLVGRCHHFMLLMLSIMRAKGIPARARCGFGAYFNPVYFEDHWVCEYWNANEKRWAFVDPQFDVEWQKELNIKHDVLDVPSDQFLVAAEAWEQCRAGKADASKFGIIFSNLRGLWYTAGNLVRDLAALNKAELLPWDVWGAQPKPNEQLNDEQLAFFDNIAALTRAPDESFVELRTLYEHDDHLRVPATVFNAVLGCTEVI